MANLIVFAFDNETEAERMRDKLVDMQKQQIITLQDAAVVIRRGQGQSEAGAEPGWCWRPGWFILGIADRLAVLGTLVGAGYWGSNWRNRWRHEGCRRGR